MMNYQDTLTSLQARIGEHIVAFSLDDDDNLMVVSGVLRGASYDLFPGVFDSDSDLSIPIFMLFEGDRSVGGFSLREDSFDECVIAGDGETMHIMMTTQSLMIQIGDLNKDEDED